MNIITDIHVITALLFLDINYIVFYLFIHSLMKPLNYAYYFKTEYI